MRTIGLSAFCLLTASAAFASPDSFRIEEPREQTLLSKLDAYWQGWIKDEARKSVSSGRITEDRARSLALEAHRTAGLDVNALSFLILMQAERDAAADLQAVMDRSQQEWEDREERSSMAHNKPPVVSSLSPGTQTVLSMQPRTVTVVSSNQPAPAQPLTPTADLDVGHLDLQTAMDREAAAEDALTAAIAHLQPATSAHEQIAQ